MSNESTLWDTLKPKLAGLDPQRIENGIGAGAPDVECIYGWIELKYIAHRARLRGDQFFKLDHFRPSQRAWLARRYQANKRAWVLLQYGNWYYLFDGFWAAFHLGKDATLDEMGMKAIAVWKDSIDREQLREYLENP